MIFFLQKQKIQVGNGNFKVRGNNFLSKNKVGIKKFLAQFNFQVSKLGKFKIFISLIIIRLSVVFLMSYQECVDWSECKGL